MAEAADADHPLPVGTQLIGEAAAARLAEKNVLLTPSGRASALAFMMTSRADRRYKDAQPLPLVT
ncbi:hypothetical protein J4W32_23265 [Escherichia coli]